jgi:hypothetical protein
MGYKYRDPERVDTTVAWRQSLIKLHNEPLILDPAAVAEWGRYMTANMVAQAEYDHQMYVQEANDTRRENGGPS